MGLSLALAAPTADAEPRCLPAVPPAPSPEAPVFLRLWGLLEAPSRGPCVSVSQSCLTLWDLMGCSSQAPLSVGSSRQEDWRGLPFLSSGDHPNPEREPVSPALQAESEPPGKPVSTQK